MPALPFAEAFDKSWRGPFRRVAQDFARYRDDRQAHTTGRVLVLCLFDRGFHFVLSRRVQEGLYFIPLLGRLLRRVLWYGTCVYFGAEIAIAAEIDGGLLIRQPAGIVLGRATIGSNVTIEHGVTLGQRSPRHPENPTIESDVVILHGAVVLGGVTVHQGAVIGARAVIIEDT